MQVTVKRVLGPGPEPYLVPVRLCREEDEGEVTVLVPMFPVHEWLANLWAQGEAVFKQTVLPPGGVPALA